MSNETEATNVTVILEGGLVREVTGVEFYDVLDLDIIEDGYADDEQLDDLLALAQALPESYSEKASIVNTIQIEIAERTERTEGTD